MNHTSVFDCATCSTRASRSTRNSPNVGVPLCRFLCRWSTSPAMWMNAVCASRLLWVTFATDAPTRANLSAPLVGSRYALAVHTLLSPRSSASFGAVNRRAEKQKSSRVRSASSSSKPSNSRTPVVPSNVNVGGPLMFSVDAVFYLSAHGNSPHLDASHEERLGQSGFEGLSDVLLDHLVLACFRRGSLPACRLSSLSAPTSSLDLDDLYLGGLLLILRVSLCL